MQRPAVGNRFNRARSAALDLNFGASQYDGLFRFPKQDSLLIKAAELIRAGEPIPSYDHQFVVLPF
jgi:hypothetical protein